MLAKPNDAFSLLKSPAALGAGHQLRQASRGVYGAIALLVLFGCASGVAHAQDACPPALQPSDQIKEFGYYFADGKSGDYTDEVGCYTNLYIAWARRGYACEAEAPNSCWLPLMRQGMANAANRGEKIYLWLNLQESVPSRVTPLDAVLDAALPVWDSIVRIDLADEPLVSEDQRLGQGDHVWDRARVEAAILDVKQKLSDRGIGPDRIPPFGLTYSKEQVNYFTEQTKAGTLPDTKNPLMAAGLGFVALEAYVAGSERRSDICHTLTFIENYTKQNFNTIPKTINEIMLVMQAYDANSALWRSDIPGLVALQKHTYDIALLDPRVVGITMWAYGRGNTTRDFPALIPAHKEVAELVLDRPMPPTCGGVSGPRRECGVTGIQTPSSCTGPRVDVQPLEGEGTNVRLNWTINDEFYATSLKVQRKLKGETEFAPIAVLPPQAGTYVDTEAFAGDPSTTYVYNVAEFNEKEPAYPWASNEVSATLYADAPATPNAAPLQGCISTVTPVFTWAAADRAHSYRIVVTSAATGLEVFPAPIYVGATSFFMPSGFLQAGQQYYWKVKSRNNAGDSGYSPIQYFTPFCGSNLTTIVAPLGGVSTAIPTFQWTPVAGAIEYWLLVGNSPDFSNPSTVTWIDQHLTGTSLLSPVAFPPGATFYVKVKTIFDPGSTTAGGWSPTVSFFFTPPNHAPVVTVSGDGGTCRVPCTASFSAQASDPDGEPVTLAWSGCASGSGATVSCPIDSPGTVTAIVTATDSRGASTTVSASASGHANAAPSVSISGPGSCIVPCAATFTATASDPDGDALTYEWSGCASGTGSSATCTAATPGPTTASVTVRDGQGGATTASRAIDVVASNRPPAVTLTSGGSCHPRLGLPCSVTVTAAATDPDGDPLTFTWSGCTSGSGSAPMQSCTVTSPTQFTATATVTDGHGGSATASTVVQGTNAVPGCWLEDAGVPPNCSYTLKLKTWDSDGDSVTPVNCDPDGCYFDGGGSGQEFDVTLNVRDEWGAKSSCVGHIQWHGWWGPPCE